MSEKKEVATIGKTLVEGHINELHNKRFSDWGTCDVWTIKKIVEPKLP